MNLKELLSSYQKEALENLQSWIRINSIYDENTVSKGKPFGEGVYQALEFIARLAEEKGFEVDRCDGYCTEIKYGRGDKIIGVYAHADVVPVSGNWKYPPFSATLENDVLYGRGTSDDKGPAIAAFYALLALKENNLIKDDYQVRLVIGGNEERGSACLEYYFHKLHKPYCNYGFTPDGEFPLIYGEKGISNYQTKGHITLEDIIYIDAGVVANSVIDKAEALLKSKEGIEEYLASVGYKYLLKDKEEGYLLTIFGKAAHGSLPQEGVNAGLQLLDVLGEVFNVDEFKVIVASYKDPSGKTLNEYYHSDLLNDTTYNVGLINYRDNNFSMVVNFRYGENVDPLKVINSINNKLPFETIVITATESLCFDPSSSWIQSLLRAYQEESGDYESKIMTIGGGTYAKECKNTVAFGSAFPGSHDNIHDADEHIELKDFYTSMPIYARAILALGEEK